MIEANQLPSRERWPDNRWALRVRIETARKPDPHDQRSPFEDRPLVVKVERHIRVLGVAQTEGVLCFLAKTRQEIRPGYYARSTRECLVLSPRPLLSVRVPYGGERVKRSLTLGRLIQANKRDIKPPIDASLQIAASSICDPSRYDGRLLHWSQLAEVAAAIDITPRQVLQVFADFSRSSLSEANVPVLSVNPATADSSQILRIYAHNIPKILPGGELAWGERNLTLLSDLCDAQLQGMWVPRAFARSVIRLVQLGYSTDGSIPESAPLLRLDAPPAPAHKLPLLS